MKQVFTIESFTSIKFLAAEYEPPCRSSNQDPVPGQDHLQTTQEQDEKRFL